MGKLSWECFSKRLRFLPKTGMSVTRCAINKEGSSSKVEQQAGALGSPLPPGGAAQGDAPSPVGPCQEAET